MKGTGLHNGVGFGPAFLIAPAEKAAERSALAPEAEKARLASARSGAEAQLSAELNASSGEQKEILEAHAMMLADDAFFSEAEAELSAPGCSAESALIAVRDRYRDLMRAAGDEYLAARADDITDVVGRVLHKLTGADALEPPKTPYVLVAEDLLPSQTVSLDLDAVRGIVTAVGSATSHAAILAKNYGIPTVIGAVGIMEQIHCGETVLVDADSGEVTVSPSEAQLAEAGARRERAAKALAEEARFRVPGTALPDGRRLPLFGNMGGPKDLNALLYNGCEGVGLFRTEFLFMQSDTPPTEEAQYLAYKEAAERLDGRPVIIRTLDAGGDKCIPYLGIPGEQNPFLGYRAIRVCLDRRDLFLTQLRAILRAGAHGNVRIMFPMISRVSEFLRAKALVEEAKASLRADGLPFPEDMPVGLMIEIPAAAVMSDRLAREADFFSIGSNDLTQYALAADRLNPRVAEIGNSLDPAVLRLIDLTVQNAAREKIPVGVCGEMAGDPTSALILSDLGVSELSMSAPLIPKVRRALGALWPEGRETRLRALRQAESPDEVRKIYRGCLSDADERQRRI